MKTAHTQIAPAARTLGAAILLATLALVTTTACTNNQKPSVVSTLPGGAHLRPAAMKTVVPATETVGMEVKPAAPSKPSGSKLLVYRSRDYGVSFVYPWQYGFVSAKAIANGDSNLQPISDGSDGQLTLARVEIPRGFYPDTDYENGYFTISLNQELTEEQCGSVLTLDKDGKVQRDTINGVDYRWIESDSGGRGQASKLRQYVSYAGGTCYEIEMGVRTMNQDGLARELDPDLVLRRLDTILRSVKIQVAEDKTVEVKTSIAVTPPAPQN